MQFYATNNNITKDIIAISISGQNHSSYKSGLFIVTDKNECAEIKTNGKLLSIKDLVRIYRKEKYGDQITTESLNKTLNVLNKDFQSNNIKDTERSLFFAGLMIALKDNTFSQTYQHVQPPTKEEEKVAKYKLNESHNLNLSIIDAIEKQISTKVNSLSKEYNWKDRFSFIKNIDFPIDAYKKLIRSIEKNIFQPFRMDEKQDILGRAYKIFLTKAGKIDNKNIILTPDHIKSLMVDLARLNIDDVIIDTCTGSGGFLMESMERLIKMANNDSTIIDRIKEKQLVGFEIDPTLFALACSNMFLHGDGRTNLIYGSSIIEEDSDVFKALKKMRPNKCIINPPYENNYSIIFTKHALDFLESNGKLIVIMPTPTLNRNIGGITDQILEIAKLDFVIKMPNNLFSEQHRTVNTSIFGFTKTPHDKSDKVLFYNMDDDGLVSVQHKGRIDKNGKWNEIKDKVIRCIKYTEDVDAEYSKKKLYSSGKVLNCYGVKENDSENDDLVKIGDLFSYQKGSLQSENSIEGKFNFITASEEWKTHSEYKHECEAIVYAISAGGSLGRSHYVNGKFTASNLCLILTPRNSPKYPINLQFYNMYLNSIRKQIVNELADGTSKLTIAPNDLMNYYVEYFDIEKQNEIVSYYNQTVLPAQQKLIEAKKEMGKHLNNLIK